MERPKPLPVLPPDELGLRRARRLLADFRTPWRDPAIPDRLREEALRERRGSRRPWALSRADWWSPRSGTERGPGSSLAMESRATARATGRSAAIWDRYGVVGLGLLAPLLVGAPLGTALGLLLGAPVRRLLLWVSVGIVLWSALLTAAGALGLAGFETLRG